MAALMEPTSLNRGEGLVSGWQGDVRNVAGKGKGETGGGEAVVEEENKRRSTMMGLMGV